MDELLAAAEKFRTDHHRLEDIVERVRRFAEALSVDNDPGRREVATELIDITGVPE